LSLTMRQCAKVKKCRVYPSTTPFIFSVPKASTAVPDSPFLRCCHHVRSMVSPSWIASLSASGPSHGLKMAWTNGCDNPALGRGSYGYSRRELPSAFTAEAFREDGPSRVSCSMGVVNGSSSLAGLVSTSVGSRPPKCDHARKAPSKMEVRCSNSPRRRDMMLTKICWRRWCFERERG
jgi:hypothetical protein